MEPTVMTLGYAGALHQMERNWRDDQDPATGRVPFVSPGWIDPSGGPAWGGSIAVIASDMYKYYGDRRISEQSYPAMQRYVAFLEHNCRDGLLVPLDIFADPSSFLGDWVPPECTMDGAAGGLLPRRVNEVFNNCYLVHQWMLLENAAHILGKTDDAKRCADRIEKLRRLIHDALFRCGKAHLRFGGSGVSGAAAVDGRGAEG